MSKETENIDIRILNRRNILQLVWNDENVEVYLTALSEKSPFNRFGKQWLLFVSLLLIGCTLTGNC